MSGMMDQREQPIEQAPQAESFGELNLQMFPSAEPDPSPDAGPHGPPGRPGIITVDGTVEKRLMNAGTKSEAERIVLVSPDGLAHILRVPGENPFGDQGLSHLVGKEVSCQAQYHQGQLFVRSISEKA